MPSDRQSRRISAQSSTLSTCFLPSSAEARVSGKLVNFRLPRGDQYSLAADRTHADPVEAAIAEVLARPCVTGWARLHPDGSATTLRNGEGRTLLTDGPFIESKEFLAGIIVVEADNLDAALAIAQELQDTRTSGAIEVRPILEALFHGA